MTNPYVPPYEEGKHITEQPMRVLMDRLNFRTAPMSVVGAMKELPEFHEVMRRGVSVLPDILDDRENFSHWQFSAVYDIALSIGEQIEFPPGARGRARLCFDIALEWLEEKVAGMRGT